MKVKSEQEMIDLGRKVAQKIAFPVVVELVGDVGAGKTTFTRGLAEGLGVRGSVTSPSFTIEKEYALSGGGSLVHYDFYRLPEPGLIAEDLTEKIAERKNAVVVEWGESVAELLPEKRIRVVFRYDEEGREVEIAGVDMI